MIYVDDLDRDLSEMWSGRYAAITTYVHSSTKEVKTKIMSTAHTAAAVFRVRTATSQSWLVTAPQNPYVLG